MTTAEKIVADLATRNVVIHLGDDWFICGVCDGKQIEWNKIRHKQQCPWLRANKSLSASNR